MKKVQIGIDLGTTNTLACYSVKGKLKLLKFAGKNMLPSVLFVEKQEDGSIREIVGKAAKIRGLKDPDNCISSSKTHIGLSGANKKTWTCHGKSYNPTDVATAILKEVHAKVREIYDLEDGDVVQAVITIPAYFTSAQSDETKRAGENAGLEVLRIITEPVAAAVSAAEDVEGKIFVVDLGGGTFDVSVLDISEKKYSTLEISGERQLGGDDFDQALVKYFLKFIEDEISMDLSSLEKSGIDYDNYYLMMAKIKNEATEAKIALSDSEEYDATIPGLFEYEKDKFYNFDMTITRDEFDELCDGLYKKIIKVIDDLIKKSKKFKKEELKKIYLVGGSCYITKIQDEIEKYFGLAPDSEQDRATQVAMGAGKIAAAWSGFTSEEGREDPFEDMLQDIISHDMGIEILGKHNKSEFSRLLVEGSAYPCKVKEEYKTSYDNQETVVIKVYEKTDSGASDFIEKNVRAFDLYGSFELKGIAPAPAGSTPIEVTFDYDKSRTLHVTARDMKNNIEQTVTLHKGEIMEEPHKGTTPTDFFLLIDVSGSMRGRRIEEAKKACIKLIQETLDLSVHRLGIICFGDSIDALCGLTQEKSELMLAVDRLEAYGGTYMAEAIDLASRLLSGKSNKKAIILITDGEPHSVSNTKEAANSIMKNGVSIAAIGVQDADMDFLSTIVKDSTLVFKVSNIEKLSDTFGQAVQNLLRK